MYLTLSITRYSIIISAMRWELIIFAAPKPSGRRSRKPGIDRKPRQAYSAKQLERLEAEFKVRFAISYCSTNSLYDNFFPHTFGPCRSTSILAWANGWNCPNVWISPRCRSKRGSRIAVQSGRSSSRPGWRSRKGRDCFHRRIFRPPSILFFRIMRRLWCSVLLCRMTRILACRLDPSYHPQIRSDIVQTRTTWSIVGRATAKCNKIFRWPLRSPRYCFLLPLFFFFFTLSHTSILILYKFRYNYK